MAHLYDKAPPAFAKDPWAWDYTRDRIEGNTGLPYDEWQGKHFAGAAAMYKNVVKKYRQNIEEGNLTIPKECVDCGATAQHYVDDYVCRDCRDAIENADSYHEAAETISRPESMDAIRDQLYKALGHDKKDAKAGRTVSDTPRPISIPAPSAKAVSRNYKAMNADKLQRSILELQAGQGDAVERARSKGEDVMEHLEAALRAQQEG